MAEIELGECSLGARVSKESGELFCRDILNLKNHIFVVVEFWVCTGTSTIGSDSDNWCGLVGPDRTGPDTG